MNQKYKILHVCSSKAWGGGEISSFNLAKSFLIRGHQIFFCANPEGRIFAELQKTGIVSIPMKLNPVFDPVSVYQLIKTIRENKIEIIHAHLSRDLVHIYWALKFLSAKPKVVLHKQVSSKVSKKDIFHRLIYSRVGKIFVLSNYLKQNVLETCPVREEEVVVIPGGIEIGNYFISPEIRKQIRDAWNISPSTFIFGTIGRIDKGKGYLELVQAFSKIVNDGVDARLVIIGEPTAGEPQFADELKELISRLKISSLIHFTGFRSDIANVLSALDVFVLPSYGEAFGYVLLEASAARLPIIATNAGGVTDIIVDNESGILIPPRDVEKLFVAMKTLLENEMMRTQLGSAARKRVEIYFEEKNILSQMEKEYQKLLSIEDYNSI